MKWNTSVIAVAASMAAASAASAKDEKDTAPPAVFSEVVDCRAVTDAAARLACYDKAVGALAEAQASRAVVVIDKEEVKEARRGLFGFSLPKIRLFGGGSDKEVEAEDIKELNSTVASARASQHGYTITLPDGAVWEMSDNDYIDKPAVGAPVLIKRGAMGSYFLKVGDGRAVRVRRKA